MPILAVEEFAAKHLWTCDFEHTVRRQSALNCAGLGRTEIGQHGAQMRLKRTPTLRPVPRDRVDAQRGGMARLKFAAQPRWSVPFGVGHPSAQASGFFWRLAQRDRFKFFGVHVHPRQVGRDELIGQRALLEKFLKQSAAMECTLTVSSQDNRPPLVPMGQIVFKGGFDVAVGHFCSEVTQRVSQAENANVSLTITRCVQPAC